MEYFIAGLIGSSFGSFLTLASQRLLLGISILQPRSHCFSCQTFLSWKELIPIFSYMKQKGRCRHCHARFPNLTFKAELFLGLLFIVMTYLNLWQIEYIPYLLILCQAIWLSMTDLIAFRVEPKIFYSMASLAILSQFILYSVSSFHLVGGVLMYGLLSFVNLGKPRLGGGDIKLISLWTVLLGLLPIAQILFVASLTALAYFLLTIKRRRRNVRLRFVPFLAFGLILYFFVHVLI